VEKVGVPFVGGPVDGREAEVPLDDDGLPPVRLGQHWLWVEYGSELLDADVHGDYELESVAGGGAPWLYRWEPGRTVPG
jgi:hypothetical protein